jgi:hypothetical protein
METNAYSSFFFFEDGRAMLMGVFGNKVVKVYCGLKKPTVVITGIMLCTINNGRVWGSVVVKVLRYQLDGPGIDSRWCHWIFQ